MKDRGGDPSKKLNVHEMADELWIGKIGNRPIGK